jgi:phage terminase small subunit
MRGRLPKPTAAKVMAGNPGKRALPTNEPKPNRSVTRPDWLTLGARQVWDQYAPVLIPIGLLTSADGDTFGRWCSLAAEFRADPGAMPASKMARMDALEQRFGLDPSSRSRISVAPQDADDDAERFFGAG